MKPDLVLDEDDKKKRFKKYNNSEEAVQSGGQNNVEPNSNYLQSSEAGNKNKRQLGPASTSKKKHLKKNSSSHERSSSLLEFPLPQSDLEDEDESRGEDFLEFVKETAGAMNVQKIFSDLAENESVIDPETGMLISTGKLEFLHSKIKSIRGKSKMDFAFHFDSFFRILSVVRV